MAAASSPPSTQTESRVEREAKFELDEAAWRAFPELAPLAGAGEVERFERRYSTVYLDSPALALLARDAAFGLHVNVGEPTGWLSLKHALAWHGPVRIAAEVVHPVDPRLASEVLAADEPPLPVRRARDLAGTAALGPRLVVEQRREIVHLAHVGGHRLVLTRDEIAFSLPDAPQDRVTTRLLELDVTGGAPAACEALLQRAADAYCSRGLRPVPSSKYALGLRLLGRASGVALR